jgi:hypothetical protein
MKTPWAREEAAKYVRDDESRGLPLIRLLLSSAESDAIIELVAAEPLKEFLDAHGQQALAQIERVAEQTNVYSLP